MISRTVSKKVSFGTIPGNAKNGACASRMFVPQRGDELRLRKRINRRSKRRHAKDRVAERRAQQALHRRRTIRRTDLRARSPMLYRQAAFFAPATPKNVMLTGANSTFPAFVEIPSSEGSVPSESTVNNRPFSSTLLSSRSAAVSK